MARQPEGPPPPPTVQKLRIRYAKRGRLRFASHRDLARMVAAKEFRFDLFYRLEAVHRKAGAHDGDFVDAARRQA